MKWFYLVLPVIPIQLLLVHYFITVYQNFIHSCTSLTFKNLRYVLWCLVNISLVLPVLPAQIQVVHFFYYSLSKLFSLLHSFNLRRPQMYSLVTRVKACLLSNLSCLPSYKQCSFLLFSFNISEFYSHLYPVNLQKLQI